jgi:FAD synthetase
VVRTCSPCRSHLFPPPPRLTPVPLGSPLADRECTLEEWRRPLKGSDPAGSPPPVVALGKFDAMHRGHAALAAAAAAMGGAPWLVSFSGIAEVLGWPPRLPLVAPCDRSRVLATWAAACGGTRPRECFVPFQDVRTMPPEAFVRLLAEELQVAGVVVGSNYRFGYKAAGTAAMLAELGPVSGMRVQILDLVQEDDAFQNRREDNRTREADSSGDNNGGKERVVVSSSRVREALSAGDMAEVARCLGRRYRLVMEWAVQGGVDEIRRIE